MSSKETRKQSYFAKLIERLDKYPKLIIVGIDNVGSNHMQNIRKNLRGKAVLLMGKNTMIRKAIKGHLNQNPQLESLLPHIRGNVGFVFTTGDLNEIRDLLIKEKIAAPAKAGAIAPCDVTVQAGSTGLDPSQTSFMQALNIATKINKGQVEIINPVALIKKDQKVGQSEATLLQKLNINPFSYGLVPLVVYDSGFCFEPNILDLKDDVILSKFLFGVQQLAALSLGAGVPTLAALPHYIATAYSNLLALSLVTDYTFDRAEKLKQLLSDPEALAAAQAAQAAAASSTTTSSAPAATEASSAPAKAAEPAPEEKKEEEEDEEGGFGDLFG